MRTIYAMLGALIGALFIGLKAAAPVMASMPVEVRFNENPWAKRTYGKVVAGGQSILGSVVATLRAVLGLFTLRSVLVCATLAVLVLLPDMAGEVLAAEAVVLTVDQRKAKLEKMLEEGKVVQAKYADKPMPQAIAEVFDANMLDAMKLQSEIQEDMERQGKWDDLLKWGGRVEDPTLPVDKKDVMPDWAIAGYMTLGDYFTAQEVIQKYMSEGAPVGQVHSVSVSTSLLSARKLADGTVVVPIDGAQRKQITETLNRAYESKAVPTIGAGVLEVDRLPGISQTTADDELVLRDVFAIGQTGTNTVEFVRRTAQTRGAAETAHGGTKPEVAFTFALITATVRTIPAWMPVQTQQLADWAQLRSEIDNFLLYDLRKREEEQLIYGLGTGVELEGLEVISGTTDISGLSRYNVTIHTLIDVIRMGITEVRTSGYRPNAVLLHPIDWESIVLLKSTTNEYIWVIVTTENGSRLWGLRVVESESMQENAGNPTEQRNLIVGDFQRGAQIMDRQQATISVGLNNDDFTTNVRTILAEERIAFPIRAPAAFAKFETQALAT